MYLPDEKFLNTSACTHTHMKGLNLLIEAAWCPATIRYGLIMAYMPTNLMNEIQNDHAAGGDFSSFKNSFYITL